MYLVPFFAVDPDRAAHETRVVSVLLPGGDVPEGSYGLVESYCPDPGCDCRRVMINVVEEKHPRRFLASISYGFDREVEDAGPYLDPLNTQCAYARALMDLVGEVALNDPRYLDRLETHYALVKRAAADPHHPAYRKLQEAIEEEGGSPPARASRPASRRIRRNDPCPCGSGKKYKHCCLHSGKRGE